MFKNFMKRIFGDPHERDIKHYSQFVEQINAREPEVKALNDSQLRDKTAAFKQRLKNGEDLDDILVEVFAVVREASRRTTGLRHFDVQLMGGMVLHQGKIAEMKTGEGKTLVATLPLYLNALTERGVHLVTPNDYLSKVGLQMMGPIYHALGLTAAVIQNYANDPTRGSFMFDPAYSSDDERYQNLRPVSRREAYLADITYGTNNEFGFDYLRDNMGRTAQDLVQREPYFAIVDEVDNILIDEARTPLIISGIADQPSDYYRLFAQLVKDVKPSTTNPEDKDVEPDGDYVYDLKTKAVFLTEAGIEKIEQKLRQRNVGKSSSLYAPENSDMLPYLDNSLRALVAFERDKDYMIEKGQVIIVDEFTGRPMYGRRFSEGLHQAIEAKEGVEIQRENLTMATVTFQNYFRMYEKLAGMTGTAMTEADEFYEIYKLDVVAIPTNLPMVREDFDDFVFMNERGKWTAIVKEIKDRHERQQPILIGTVAIETSERLTKLLEKANIPNRVLNAKQHEREAVVIAQAGRPGSVTIATNMAGRGVDILLGGNPEGLAREKLRQQGIEITEATPEQWQTALNEAKTECARDREVVLKAGGLFVLGTERHEARRIDNQLRGRSGRQGDPGESQFYLSLEDELMKRFGGERVKGLMQTLQMPEDEPIRHNLITKSIQQAQTRVEGYNFDIRKRVLEYDDVVNKQRTVIYDQRQQIMAGENLRPQIEEKIVEAITDLVDQYLPDNREAWELEELHRAALSLFPVPQHIQPENWEAEHVDEEAITLELTKGALEVYDNLEKLLTPSVMRMLERDIMLMAIDQHWVRHLTDLDMLREGIGLMAIAQRDPLVEYKREAFLMWEAMQKLIRDNLVRNTLNAEKLIAPQVLKQLQVQQAGPTDGTAPADGEQVTIPAPETLTINTRNVRNVKTGFGSSQAYAAPTNEAPPQPITPQTSVPEPVRADMWSKAQRNDPCPCGSGKKYKNCHWRERQEQRNVVSQDQVKRTPKVRR